MNDQKYNGTKGLDQRLGESFIQIKARMKTNHLHLVNSKNRLPENKCKPTQREKTPEGSIETTEGHNTPILTKIKHYGCID